MEQTIAKEIAWAEALMHGTEEHYKLGEKIALDMYQPIHHTHRITLEQMAILEPAMVETLAQTCMEVVKEGYDHTVALGVPEAAARDFVPGFTYPDCRVIQRSKRHFL